MIISERSFLNTIFRIASSKKIPTPTPIVEIKRIGRTAFFTCSASTDKSGSATVMRTPITKHTETSNRSLRDLVKPDPTYAPIGVIARSAPRLKSPIPIIKKIALTVKTICSFSEKVTSGVCDTTSTISVMGKTEAKASFSFSKRIFCIAIKYILFLTLLVMPASERAPPFKKNFSIHATARNPHASKITKWTKKSL